MRTPNAIRMRRMRRRLGLRSVRIEIGEEAPRADAIDRKPGDQAQRRQSGLSCKPG